MSIFHPTAGEALDGYRLIRFIGRGGFGEVWLCRSEAMGDYRALKWISATDTDRLEKEYQSLQHYRNAASRLRSPHLVSIEHVNRNQSGLYYVMPLADGVEGQDPSDPAWQPMCLASKILARKNEEQWFSSNEIRELIVPILHALQTLSEAGLVHRDVKPDNILFFDGKPCLGDISLLGADASEITRRGTPGFATPSWYIGGHPDMFGTAATLFALLTGNSPDKMGRAAFLWPPQQESSLLPPELAEWKRLHAVIRRATSEAPSERFVDFATMAAGINGVLPTVERFPRILVSCLFLAGVVSAILIANFKNFPAVVEPMKSLPEGLGDHQKITNDETVQPHQKISKSDELQNNNSLRKKIIDAIPYVVMPDTNGRGSGLNIDALSEQLEISRSYESRDYSECFSLLSKRTDSDPSLLTNPLTLLFKALLLRHLDRINEMEEVLTDYDKLPAFDDSETQIRLDFMEALGRHTEAEEFITSVIGRRISELAQTTPEVARKLTLSTVKLYNRRARVRILTDDLPGVLTDELAALNLPPDEIIAWNESEDRAEQSHHNTVVMQWKLLEQEFPAYASYLESEGSPEPKRDHRDLEAID